MRFAQKLYYLFFAFFTILFVAMVLYVYWVETRGIKHQLKQEFEALSAELVSASVPLIQNQNYGMLYRNLNDLVLERNATNRLLICAFWISRD